MAQRPKAHRCKCQSRSSSFRYSLSSSVLISLSLLFSFQRFCYSTHPYKHPPPPNTTLSQEDSPLGVWASNCICSCEETCEVLQTVYSKCQLKTRIPVLLMKRAIGMCLWKANVFEFYILLHAHVYFSTAFIALATKWMPTFHNASFGCLAVYGYKPAHYNGRITFVFALHIVHRQHPKQNESKCLTYSKCLHRQKLLNGYSRSGHCIVFFMRS